MINTAGVGAGNSKQQQPVASVSRAPTHHRAPSQRQAQAQVNGTTINGGASSQSQAPKRPPQTSYRPPQDPNAEPIDPTVDTLLRVGANAYKVDLAKDPQQGPSRPRATSSSNTAPPVVDPLAKQLEELKNAVSGSGTVRRSGTWKPTDPRLGQPVSRKGTLDSAAGPSNLNPLSSSTQPPAPQRQQSRDYRLSAENVVGVHPSASRPASPNPPTASFMQDPAKVSPRTDVGDIVAQYQQSFPGERKPVSRSNSAQGNPIKPPAGGLGHSQSLSQGQNLARPVSREGHAGVGAHGRSSPQPMSRSASPAAANRPNVAPPQRRPPLGPLPSPGPTYYPGNARAVSPNRVGIALDPNGTVVVDSMAERYNQQQQMQLLQQQQQREREQQQQQQQQAQQQQQQQQMQAQQYGAAGRRASYIAMNNGSAVPPPNLQPGYGVVPPVAAAPYQVANPPYMNAPGPQRRGFNPAYQQQQPVYQQPVGYGPMDGVPRGQPITAGYDMQMRAPPNQMPPPQPGYGGYPPPNTMARTPSPLPPADPPTGQKTEEGLPILFYGEANLVRLLRVSRAHLFCSVKALYDYSATIEEEFDFQSGDIIAVTATPEDGWWSGQLLDEARRQRGRHVFPSNFVCLF